MPMELNLETYRAVLEALPFGTYLVDRERRIVFWNAAAGKISGYLGQEVIGRFCPDNLLMHCDENHKSLCGTDCPLANTMQDGRPRDADVFLRHKEGHRVAVHVRSAAIRDESGAIVGSAEFFDERSFRAAETRSRGVGTRAAGQEETADCSEMRAAFQRAIDEFAVSGKPFGVLCMLIDDLEHVRHVYGWHAVSTIRSEATRTIAGSLRPSDKVGLWQGEPVAALIDCPTGMGLLGCAERLKRLVSLTAIPWWGDRISVTMSMGGTMARAGDSVESLMQRAEEALEASMAECADSILVV
jgi:PAS domain S-box-containing protein